MQVDHLMSLLPASRRTCEDDLEAFDTENHASVETGADPCFLAAIHDWIDKETDLTRLAAIHNSLWVVGRPVPPRPLHYQRLLGRQVVITERLDLHLVWTKDRIFIKPLPRFLLEPFFWAEYLHCRAVPPFNSHGNQCGDCSRRARSLGFLFSYAALIAHESDFHIAREAHLIPEEVQWLSWRKAVQELLAPREAVYSMIDPSFYYGELRLSRLNKIYLFWKTPLRGYMSRWNRYGTFFHDNFALLASSTVYVVVVLTAIQVGLATQALQNSAAFQSASYGFTVFAIVGPLAAASVAVILFFYLVTTNWIMARRYKEQRLRRIQGRRGCESV